MLYAAEASKCVHVNGYMLFIFQQADITDGRSIHYELKVYYSNAFPNHLTHPQQICIRRLWLHHYKNMSSIFPFPRTTKFCSRRLNIYGQNIVAKRKVLITSNFFFCHFVFKKLYAAEVLERVYSRERVKNNCLTWLAERFWRQTADVTSFSVTGSYYITHVTYAICNGHIR